MSAQTEATITKIVNTERPFSGFQFTEDHFAGTAPIRRLFSLGRGHGARTLVVEDIPSAGAVADENAEITGLAPDYKLGDLKRISFWKKRFKDKRDIAGLNSRQCVGYTPSPISGIPSMRTHGHLTPMSCISRLGTTSNMFPAAHG